MKVKTSYVTNCRWLYLWRLRNFLSFYAHRSSSFLTSRSWRIKANLLKSVWLNHHKITKLTVQALTRVKITPSAACSFKPNHLKILIRVWQHQIHICMSLPGINPTYLAPSNPRKESAKSIWPPAASLPESCGYPLHFSSERNFIGSVEERKK